MSSDQQRRLDMMLWLTKALATLTGHDHFFSLNGPGRGSLISVGYE